MTAAAHSDQSTATPTSNEHGFDVAAFETRVRAELSRRRVPLERNEHIYLAKLYATRARERFGESAAAEHENMFAHPLWAHVASAHDETRQSRVPDCKDCALLWTLWIPYALERNIREKNRVALAKACRIAVTTMAKVKPLLAADPNAIHDLEMLKHLERRLSNYATPGAPNGQSESKPDRRRGRRPLTLLREIEQTLKPVCTAPEIAQLVFGNSNKSTVRSVRDRRRPIRAKRKRSEK